MIGEKNALLSVIAFNETIHPISPVSSIRLAEIHFFTQARQKAPVALTILKDCNIPLFRRPTGAKCIVS